MKKQLPQAKGYARRCSDRTGYLTPAGKLPSVTTVVGETKSEEAKRALANWQQRMAGQPEALQLAPARRGSWAHLQAENWIQANSQTANSLSSLRDDLPGGTQADLPGGSLGDLPGGAQRAAWGGYWRSLQGWLEANFHSALAIEKPIWHPAGFSGTFDCLGWTYDSTEISLLDWKTRGGKPLDPYGEQIRGYCVQLAAYRAGISWTYGIDVEQAHLVIARIGEAPQVIHLDSHLLQECEEEFFYRLHIYQERYSRVVA